MRGTTLMKKLTTAKSPISSNGNLKYSRKGMPRMFSANAIDNATNGLYLVQPEAKRRNQKNIQ